jgi:DNA mismatch repair protein MutS
VFDKSIIITGPNAGGKSTMIKSILIAVILAQTIGFANAGDIGMTPFYYISSQMNIPDCKGKESLFEAEMFRSKRHLDVLKSLEKSQKSVIFMDEIFNSTNPVEGIAGAFAIAKNMAKYENNLSIITTHYLYLTKLSKNNFKNIKMNIKYTESGDIIYPYKLTKGVSKQFIAIEILQKHGFDENIVKDALEIKESLLIV